MGKITEEEWQNLFENFETRWILEAVDQVDSLRDHFNDGEFGRPPEIRDKLLKLHQLAMEVVNEGWLSRGQELFDLASELEDQMMEAMESIEFVNQALNKLTALYPESLDYDE